MAGPGRPKPLYIQYSVKCRFNGGSMVLALYCIHRRSHLSTPSIAHLPPAFVPVTTALPGVRYQRQLLTLHSDTLGVYIYDGLTLLPPPPAPMHIMNRCLSPRNVRHGTSSA